MSTISDYDAWLDVDCMNDQGDRWWSQFHVGFVDRATFILHKADGFVGLENAMQAFFDRGEQARLEVYSKRYKGGSIPAYIVATARHHANAGGDRVHVHRHGPSTSHHVYEDRTNEPFVVLFEAESDFTGDYSSSEEDDGNEEDDRQ